MEITLQYFDGCPHWQLAGSPTILVEGTDPFATGDEPAGLSCRIYDTPDGPDGAPTLAQLRQALGP